jgi:hypothetical protein
MGPVTDIRRLGSDVRRGGHRASEPPYPFATRILSAPDCGHPCNSIACLLLWGSARNFVKSRVADL